MRKIACGHCKRIMGRERYFAQWWDDVTRKRVSRSIAAFCSSDCALTHHDDTPFFEKRIIGLKPGELLTILDDLNYADGGGNSQGSVKAGTVAQFVRQDVDDTGTWIYIVCIDYDDNDFEISVFPEDVEPEAS